MSWFNALKVYTTRDVVVVMLLGFASGLPLALSGSSLSFWLAESAVDIKTIGLFAAVGTPYALKFLWAPVVDAIKIPLFSRLGHRRGWLLFSQIALALSVFAISFLNPKIHIEYMALVAVVIAFCSATQDIIIDSYRVETLAKDEQAAGVGAYVAAYRIAMLVSGAGLFFLVSYLEKQGYSRLISWQYGFIIMVVFMAVGICATLYAREPNITRANNSSVKGVFKTAITAFKDFALMDSVVAVLIFIILFKLCDALAGNMTAPFVNAMGFSRDEYAVIVKGVGFAATIFGGFAGGAIAKKLDLYHSLWLAAILQMLSNLAFLGLSLWGKDNIALSLVVIVENFTGAIGSVIFVAYLSSLCKNPLHTATQFALLTALSAVGRTYLSAGSGWLVESMGWNGFFLFTVVTALPAIALLIYLKRQGSFAAIIK